MKKIVGYIMIVLLFAGSICGLVFGIKYNNVKDHEWNMEIENEYISEIDKLKITIQENMKKIEEYETKLSNTQKELDNLLLNLGDKENEIESNLKQIEDLKTQIELLDSEIIELQNSIKYYEELVASYDFADKSIITFKVKDNVYDVVVVENNVNFNKTIEDPKLLGYSFAGWSIDNVEPIILNETSFSNDTVLCALFTAENQEYRVDSSFVHANDNDSNSIPFLVYSNTVTTSLSILGNEVEQLSINSLYNFSKEDSVSRLFDEINLSEFAKIKDNIIEVCVPMSYVRENFPERATDRYNYLNCKFTYENGVLSLTEITDWPYQTAVENSIQLVVGNYNFACKNTFNGNEIEMVCNFSEKYGGIKSGVLKEENSLIKYVGEDFNIEAEESNGFYLIKWPWGSYELPGQGTFYNYFEIIFYINEDFSPVIIALSLFQGIDKIQGVNSYIIGDEINDVMVEMGKSLKESV